MKNIHQTEEFNSTIGSTDPVIIKFEADWCPDCKAMDMWIDQLLKNIIIINGMWSIVTN